MPGKAARAASARRCGSSSPAAAPSTYGIAGVLVAAAVVFFAYSGFEAVANLGRGDPRPGKDMPRGLLGTLGICTLLYVGVCW